MCARVKQTVEMFNEGYSCSQAIFTIYGVQFGIDKDTALKIGSGLGGGIGATGNTCGAAIGAVLVLGLKFGSTNPKDKNAKYATYKKVREFCDEFKARAGSLLCRELLGFDFMTPQGALRAKQPGAFEHCPEFVQIAAEILESMLKE